MSAECDIGRLAIRKAELLDELAAVRRTIKSQVKDVTVPFAVEIDGQVVTVRNPYPDEGMPQITIAPLVEKCPNV